MSVNVIERRRPPAGTIAGTLTGLAAIVIVSSQMLATPVVFFSPFVGALIGAAIDLCLSD